MNTEQQVEIIVENIKEFFGQGNYTESIRLCREGIPLTEKEQFEDWYALRIILAASLLSSSEDDNIPPEHIEDAVSIYNEILAVISSEKYPEKWANTHRNIAYTYIERTKGEKQDNLAKAIEHDTMALSVYTQDEYPVDWAMIKAGIGLAYSERTDGSPENNIRKGIENYEDTLQVYTKEEYPDDYEDTLNMLRFLKQKAEDQKKRNIRKK